MSFRRTIARAAIALSALALSSQPTLAQSPSAEPSKQEASFRDFEKEPPTKLGTKLDTADGWDDAQKPALIRPSLVVGGHLIDPSKCEMLVKDDWLKIGCDGPPARVNQLAGDTGDVVVYMSNQLLLSASGSDDRRRLTLFIRLAPGNVTVLEVTGVTTLTGGYNDQDWEGAPSLVTVDWSDTDSGPRIHLAQTALMYLR